jgi:hypothetical protein
MEPGTVIAIFALGAVFGALMESIVRTALKERIKRRFVHKLNEEETRRRVG